MGPGGYYSPLPPGSPCAYSGGSPGGCAGMGMGSPMPGSPCLHGPGNASPMPGGMFGPQSPSPGSSFLNLFGGDTQLTLQEIADKAHQLQQKIGEHAEQEKAGLRAAAEQKHQEIERHAAELSRHAAGSIEAHKLAQVQGAERQKAYQQAVVRQQAEQAKRVIDQQAAQAVAALETRERHLELQRQQQEMRQGAQAATFLGGPAAVPLAPSATMPYRHSSAGAGVGGVAPGSPQSYSRVPAPSVDGHSWAPSQASQVPMQTLPSRMGSSELRHHPVPAQTVYPGAADHYAPQVPAHTVYPGAADHYASQAPAQTLYPGAADQYALPPTLPPRAGTIGTAF